ncbi:MAG: transglutaminase family protein, partial [Planctomycetota bacterium]
ARRRELQPVAAAHVSFSAHLESDAHGAKGQPETGSIATALCAEVRQGHVCVFLPPVASGDDFLELVAAVEDCADELGQSVVVEGYLPPSDHRLASFKVTPDPGVVEVNIQPMSSWPEIVETTEALYGEARETRLGTEKFDLDGGHYGTGGGNHIVLGAATPLSSPFLRRPDLLRSLLSYWNNHPSLSYLFAGRFIGPTSQAPRVDESRTDALYELQIAFEQLPERGDVPPWLVDRVFRNLLVDVTGNTHRAEFCIDKLYSPDSPTGRLGLVELRSFEMPPHERMSLLQVLLIRALVSKFWERPYRERLVHWGTSLHDRFMLPHFLESDLGEVVRDLRDCGLEFDRSWFRPQLEFRCPRIGEFCYDEVQVELRQAIEPWYVLGEEPNGGATTRFVDGSVQRVQVLSRALSERYAILCNGRVIPAVQTAVEGERVGAVRFRSIQAPHSLHPTVPAQSPLRFDVVDRWQSKSIGGATYHAEHPGGLNPDGFPVNAREAEGRRGARFSAHGRTGRRIEVVDELVNRDFPLTLDLRQ